MREVWERHPGGLHVCMGLQEKSPPFDAGSMVELKFALSPCHGVAGGELRLRIDADEAARYEIGAEFSIRIREI